MTSRAKTRTLITNVVIPGAVEADLRGRDAPRAASVSVGADKAVVLVFVNQTVVVGGDAPTSTASSGVQLDKADGKWLTPVAPASARQGASVRRGCGRPRKQQAAGHPGDSRRRRPC